MWGSLGPAKIEAAGACEGTQSERADIEARRGEVTNGPLGSHSCIIAEGDRKREIADQRHRAAACIAGYFHISQPGRFYKIQLSIALS